LTQEFESVSLLICFNYQTFSSSINISYLTHEDKQCVATTRLKTVIDRNVCIPESFQCRYSWNLRFSVLRALRKTNMEFITF